MVRNQVENQIWLAVVAPTFWLPKVLLALLIAVREIIKAVYLCDFVVEPRSRVVDQVYDSGYIHIQGLSH
jgi:hypothetical protein